jgi:hypothetical protein
MQIEEFERRQDNFEMAQSDLKSEQDKIGALLQESN